MQRFQMQKFPDLFLWILFVVICEIISINGNQCSLKNGECTYNIYLSNNGDCSPTSGSGESSPWESGGFPRQQNDNQVSTLADEVHVVTKNHGDRIRELEFSVQKLLRDAMHSGPRNNMPDGPVSIGSSRSINRRHRNRTENNLLSRLGDEFSKLRNNLRDKTLALLDAEAKLNETMDSLQEAQEDLFETGEQLITAEHRAAMLQQERYILKNQIKHKTTMLTEATEDLNITRINLRDTETQLYKLVRSEANLKEELGYYKHKLNETQNKLASLRTNHTRLRHQHTRTVKNLKKTELELMECYTAKTQASCGFEEDDICGFIQENETDDFQWTRARVQTPSSGTGPTGDHTCGPKTGGHFMYVEASAKKPNLSAVLKSIRYRGLEQQCAQFYYHMYGRHVGTLNVYTKTTFSEDPVSTWRTYGDQGDVWILARLAIPQALARIGYQLVFDGRTGIGYQGDIAIDDISVKDGPCPSGGSVVQVLFDPASIRTNATVAREEELAQARRFRKFRKIFRRRNRNRNGQSSINNSTSSTNSTTGSTNSTTASTNNTTSTGNT